MKEPKDEAKELSGIELSTGGGNSDDLRAPDMSIGIATSICGAILVRPGIASPAAALTPPSISLPAASVSPMPRPIAGASVIVSEDGAFCNSSEPRPPLSADCAVPIGALSRFSLPH